MNASEQTELTGVLLKMWLICYTLSSDLIEKCSFPSCEPCVTPVLSQFLMVVFVQQLVPTFQLVIDVQTLIDLETKQLILLYVAHGLLPKQMERLCGRQGKHLFTLVYSAGNHGHVPGFSSQQLPAGVSRGHKGQRQRRNDHLLSKWRASN